MAAFFSLTAHVVASLFLSFSPHSFGYVIDDSVGLGRRFDGIGGLSGGGATSRLLVSYPEEQRNQILDFLFKPNFGASLHILKVEIGGDSQSTDGTESSHMHSADDENYNRGYEWWLMTEAKKRNPDILLYGLPWAFPAWVGGGSTSPYTHPNLTAHYISKWVSGAKKNYNLDINYIGIWNERSYNKDYIKTLRKTLDADGFASVKIVAADSSFAGISKDILNDKELSDAVSIIGAHYPGTHSDDDAVKTGKQLWSSEDYSTYNDLVGTGCWARILVDNYVNGQMTSTISWNLIASYYDGLPFFRDGLMTAIEPWSGNYTVSGPIWVSAHHTQFTAPGFYYLKNEYGSGRLDKGGSYVTLVDPNNKKDFSIIIQAMTHDHSVCIRPHLPQFTVEPQDATFQLKGSFGDIEELQLWTTTTSVGEYFQKSPTPVKVVNGSFTLHVGTDEVLTLTTRNTGQKGNYPIPPSKPFPLPYKDNFDAYKVNSEASFFADQTGVYEIAVASDTSHGNVMRQVVPTRPITWCNDAEQTISIIGSKDWGARNVTVDVLSKVEGGVFAATQISSGGCGVAGAKGVYFWLMVGTGKWTATEDLAGKKVLSSGDFTSSVRTWYTLNIVFKDPAVATFTINGKMVGSVKLSSTTMKGFVGFGTSGFFAAEFDNFSIE